MAATDATAAGLCAFVDASPSPVPRVRDRRRRLDAARIRRAARDRRVAGRAGRYYLIRGGS